MFRSLVKSTTAHAVSWTGLDEVARANFHRRRMPFVVCYHRVVERLDADRLALPSMEISVAMLEKHLDWLGRHFHIVSLDELPAKLEQSPDSRPLAAVTFDDGYGDIYHHAFPLLKRKGIPAGIFVVTDLVGSTELPVHERLHATLVRVWARSASPRNHLTNLLRAANARFPSRERLPRAVQDPFTATCFLMAGLPQADIKRVLDSLELDEDIDGARTLALEPLNWERLATMRDAGMTIGSHSKTHPFLNNENMQRVREETDTSRSELERRLGTPVKCFAYPGGSFSPSIVRAVADAGYHLAFTVCRHQDAQHPLLTIPRKGLWQQSCLDLFGRFSPEIMSCQAAGTFDWASSCGRHAHKDSVNREFSERMLHESVETLTPP